MLKWFLGVLLVFVGILLMIFFIALLGSSYWLAALLLMTATGYVVSEYILPYFFGENKNEH